MLKYSNKATFCGGLPFPFSLGHKSMRTKGRNNDRELCMAREQDGDSSPRKWLRWISSTLSRVTGDMKDGDSGRASPNLHETACSCHKVPDKSLTYHLWKHSPIGMLLAWCLVTVWAAGGELPQGTESAVTLELSQASGPRDSFQTRSGREQGALCSGEGALHVVEFVESYQAPVDCNLQLAGSPSTFSIKNPFLRGWDAKLRDTF